MVGIWWVLINMAPRNSLYIKSIPTHEKKNAAGKKVAQIPLLT